MAKLVLNDVSVSFPVFNAKGRSIKSSLINSMTGGKISELSGSISVQALNKVSLTMREGDRLGLLGHNGAGKSTLLRVMAGIYEPTDGSVETEGKITSMFTPNIGVSMEASGWDNIVTRGILLGLNAAEIEHLTSEVAEVSGLGEFLDMPVRTYSSGMQMRLAFSVSTCMSPEILLLDEAILAGDASFIVMARRRLDRLIEDANVLVLASHSQAILRQLCNKGALLNRGHLTLYDSVDDMIESYMVQIKS